MLGSGITAAGQAPRVSGPIGSGAVTAAAESGAGVLEDAQRLFYMAQFAEAAESALAHTTAAPTDLAAYELRTSALHFQIRRAMGPGAPPCTGFGPGCLVPPKPPESAQRAFCPG